MKTLIKSNIKNTKINFFIFLILYSFSSSTILNKNTESRILFIFLFSINYFTIIMISNLKKSENESNINRLFISLGVTRKEIVISRYIYILGFLFLEFLLIRYKSVDITNKISVDLFVYIINITILIISISIPNIFDYKGYKDVDKKWKYLSVLVIIYIIYLLKYLNIGLSTNLLKFINILIALLLFYISFKVSIRKSENTDY